MKQLPTIVQRAVVAVLCAAAVVGVRNNPLSAGKALVGEVGRTGARLLPGSLHAPASTVAATDAEGPFLGFDTMIYPGDRAMRAWLASGSYDWVGYYLPAPCHKDASWSGKRQTLEGMGWGLAVVYVGQQKWEGRKARRSKSNGACSTKLLSAAQGRLEADDAIAKTEAEGFPRGTVIFLDIEQMDLVSPAMRDYYKAWTDRIVEDGRYEPGYYAHNGNARRIYGDVKQVLAARGVDADPQFWIAGGRSFSRDAAPQQVGHHFAMVWQGMLDIYEKRNGVKLPIDVNVSARRSPSSHQYATITLAAARAAAPAATGGAYGSAPGGSAGAVATD